MKKKKTEVLPVFPKLEVVYGSTFCAPESIDLARLYRNQEKLYVLLIAIFEKLDALTAKQAQLRNAR